MEISNIKSKNGILSYEVFFKDLDVTETVQESKLANGDLKMVFSDGEKTNVLITKSNGDMYLDGNLVTIQTTYESEKEVIQPRLGVTTIYDEDPLRGSASQYNIYITKVNHWIDFGMALSNLTLGALGVIISGVFGWYAFGVGVIATLVQNYGDPYSLGGKFVETTYRYSGTLSYPDIEAKKHKVQYYNDGEQDILFTEYFYSLKMYV